MIKALGSSIFLTFLVTIIVFLIIRKEKHRWRVFLGASFVVLILTILFDVVEDSASLEDYSRPVISLLLVGLLYLFYCEWLSKKAKNKTLTDSTGTEKAAGPE